MPVLVNRTVPQVGWSPLHYAVLGGHVAAVEALLCAGAYPCFRDNHLISPLHLASTQAGDRVTFQRIAELLGPSALLARDEVSTTAAAAAVPAAQCELVVELTTGSRFFVECFWVFILHVFSSLGAWCVVSLWSVFLSPRLSI